METIKTLYMDLLDRDRFGSQILHAKQDESNSRKACLELYVAGVPWAIPPGAAVALRYKKQDKTGGLYDALPGTDEPAYTIAEDRQRITWTIAPQVLTCAGLVTVDMLVVLDDKVLATFSWSICVEASPLSGSQLESQDFFHSLWMGRIDKTLTQPGQAADAAETGKVKGIALYASQRADEAYELASQGGGGVDSTASALLISILRDIINPIDLSARITALEKALAGGGGGDEPIEPDEPVDPEATLVSIIASYTGGDVAVGTALSALTGISVMAVYSDGSTATVTDYTLSGEIVEGENTITVTYEGMTATFTVTGIDTIIVEPVYVLESPLTTDGASLVDTGYALAEKDKDWAIVSELTGSPSYGLPAWGLGNYLGMWARSGWTWYCGYNYQRNYTLEGEAAIATGALTNFKTVLIHNKGEETITCYYVSDSAVVSAVSSKRTYSNIVGTNTTVTLGGVVESADNSRIWGAGNTINDFKIYARALTEDEIKEYLGVA